MAAPFALNKTVYVETSVFSAFVSHREDVASVYRRDTTRQWWAIQAQLGVINRRLGLLTPQIVTPESLWMEE